ncbi:MAG: hypothetical protein J5867_01875 [Prevotella sp.]|nr:hypothetical protein [Prevotella sp.]
MKHPQAVFAWIARQPKEKDNIWVIVFGEGKGIVGFPTKERVTKDVYNIEDVKDRKTILYQATLLHIKRAFESANDMVYYWFPVEVKAGKK